MKKSLLMLLCLAAIGSMASAKTYELVTDLSEITNPDNSFVIVTAKPYNSAIYGVSALNTKDATAVKVADATNLPSTFETDANLLEFRFEANGTNNYALYCTSSSMYVGGSGKTDMAFNATLGTTDAYKLTVTKEGENSVKIVSAAGTTRCFAFQNGTSFKNYATSNLSGASYAYPAFYKESAGGNVPSEPVAYEPNFADVELWEGNSVTLDLGIKHPDVVFVSNNESVATVSGEGVITGVGIGETTITAMWDATEEFLEGETEFNVSVVVAPEGFFDVLTIDKFSDAASSYKDVSYTSTVTGIKYEGNLMKSGAANGECIQLRWNADDATKRAGIFNTENPNGLVLASVSIEWNPTTSNNNIINVYSADKALSIADMLNAEIVEQFTKDASCKAAHDFVAPAAYFGLRSNKNAHYIKSITLFWVKADVPAIEFPSFGEAEHSFTTESSEIRIADADHAFDIFYLHTPAQGNPEAYAEGETADSFDNKAEFDEANGEHVIPVSESGTLSYYAVHTATGTQGATETVKVTKTATTAIDAIGTDAAEGEAEYFDIRGVKVNIDNAAPGLYIRRQGTTATKVIVK